MSESVGAKLKQARELRRFTLEQVAETTRIRPHYLQALENDDHSAIPSAAQARGFLRIYADFLELNLADMMPFASQSEPVPVAPSAIEETPSANEHSIPQNIFTRLRARFARPSEHTEIPNQPVETAHPIEDAGALPADNTASESVKLPSSDANKPKIVKKKRNVKG